MSSLPVSAQARLDPVVRSGVDGWDRALRAHPDLGPLAHRVEGLSGTLARRFRETVLSRQAFASADAEAIARECVAGYLADRLRDDPQSRRFAGLLAQGDHHAALADFVGAIKVLGAPAFAQISASVLQRHRLALEGDAIGSATNRFAPPELALIDDRPSETPPRTPAFPGHLLRRAEVPSAGAAGTHTDAAGPRPRRRDARGGQDGLDGRPSPGASSGLHGARALGDDDARAASPFARIAACLIDWATGLGPVAVAIMTRPSGVPIDAMEAHHIGGMAVLSILALFIVQTWMIAVRGQSIGKLALGLRIVRTDTDDPPGFARGVVLRGALTYLVYGVPMIGLLVFAIDALLLLRPDRRTLHDIVADTQVVRA